MTKSLLFIADRFFKTRIKTNPSDPPNVVNNERPEPSRIVHPRPSTDSFALCASPTQMEEPTAHDKAIDVDLAALTKAQLKALEQQRAQEEFGVDFGSSESESQSSTNTNHEAFSPVPIPKGLGIGYKDPLLHASKRTVPKKPSNLSLNESYTSQYDTLSKDSPQQMGFSFRPGDDAEALAQRLRTGQTPKRPLTYYSRPQSYEDKDGQSKYPPLIPYDKLAESPHPKADYIHMGRTRRPPIVSSISFPRPRDIQEAEGLKRDDSAGSIVTALRDNSGRSSANSSQKNGQARRRLDRNTGSSEAVTAAARALSSAPGPKRSLTQRKSGSESVDGS